MIAGIRWQILVDWANAGVWDADGSDVSADVLGLRWQWGRRGLPAPEFAPPAELELTLHNNDHRYTPGNTGGPLGSNVQPGRAVWLRASRICDDFSAAGGASANLHGRTTPAGNARWQVSAVNGNGFVVASGAAKGQGGGWPPSDAVALLDAGDPLATLTARYRRGSNGLGGFVLRCAARNNCLRLRLPVRQRLHRPGAGFRVNGYQAGRWHGIGRRSMVRPGNRANRRQRPRPCHQTWNGERRAP